LNQPLTKIEAIESRIDTNRVSGTSLSSEAGGLAFTNVTEAMEFAKLMAVSDIGVRKHLRGNPGACLGVVVQAVEWGLSPYQVANRSYLVNDQLAYESALIQAVILKRAPIKGRIRFAYEGEGDQRVCIASAVDLDGDTVEYRSPALGKITPKNSPLWKNDPDQQLAYYSGRSLCRRHFPDVLLGIYDRDELDGAEPMRDVTPKSSGLAARLKGEPQGGFNPAGVAEALGGGEASRDATDEPADPVDDKPAQHDPEMERAGAQAAIDGEAREAPEELSDADRAAWLSGYDAVRAGQEGGE
jgi:hypothetical protein